jgi:hypothetical protein
MANTQWLLLCQMPYFSQIKRQITVNITLGKKRGINGWQNNYLYLKKYNEVLFSIPAHPFYIIHSANQKIIAAYFIIHYIINPIILYNKSRHF